MMTENERRASPKNRWTRWYMWLAYGVILVVIAVGVMFGVVAMAMHGDGEDGGEPPQHGDVDPPRSGCADAPTPQHQQPRRIGTTCNSSPTPRMASLLMKSIARSCLARRLLDDGNGHRGRGSLIASLMLAAPAGRRRPMDQVFGFNLRSDAQECHRQIQDPKTLTLRSACKPARDPGFTRREADEAVIGAHFAVMAEDGVQDIVTYYDSDAIAIVVTVQMATHAPPVKNYPRWKRQPSAAPPPPPGRTSRTASPYHCQPSSMT